MTRPRETAIVAGGLLALLLLAVIAEPVLLTKPLWLDEVHTTLVAGRATPGQVMSDIFGGVDTAPGLFHLILWAVGKATGGLSPVVLHAFTMLAAWLGLVFAYATLRRRFAVLPSLAGALAIGTNPIVMLMAFEARFYAPWLMIAAGIAWALGLERSRRRDACVALFSILLCTIHWYGVVSLVLIAAAVMVVHGREWRRGLRLLAPSAAGLVVLVMSAPILLGQRAAVTVPTWISPPSWGQAWIMSRTFYVGLVPVLSLVVILASLLRRQPASRRLAPPDPGIAALVGLALMPVAIAAISLILQPTLLDRYATVAALAWAPLAAYAVHTLHARARVLFVILLVGAGVMNVRRAAGDMRAFERVVAADEQSFRAAIERTRLPVVFQTRHVMYTVDASDPAARARVVFLALPDTALERLFPTGSADAFLGPFYRFEREAALLHERRYRFPRTLTPAQLDTVPQFILLATDRSLGRAYGSIEGLGQRVFPTYQITRLEPNLTLFTRTPSP